MKICHFIWIDSTGDGKQEELNTAEYFSITTFRHHHPDWKIILHTNCTMAGDLWNKVKDFVQVIPASLSSMTFRICHACQYADWYRYFVLYTYGGMYCDLTDTITIGNFDEIMAKADRLTNGNAKYGNHWHSGWLCVNHAGDKAAEMMMQLPSNSMRYKPETRSAFESYAFTFLKPYSKSVNFDVVYPFHFRDANNVIASRSVSAQITPNTKQIHWYASVNAPTLDSQAKFRRDQAAMVDADNWRTADCAYADALRIAFGVEASSVDIPPSNWSFPSHVVAISLHGRSDRRKKLQDECTSADIPLSFYDAQRPIKGANGWGRGPGEHACSVSHQGVIRMALCLGWDSVMILEDDAKIPHDFRQRMAPVLAGCPDTADILVVGHNPHKRGSRELRPVSSTVGVPAIPDIWGLQCYIVRKGAFRRLLDRWEEQIRAIDIDLSQSGLNPHYSLSPVVSQRNPFGDSDIQRIKHGQKPIEK